MKRLCEYVANDKNRARKLLKHVFDYLKEKQPTEKQITLEIIKETIELTAVSLPPIIDAAMSESNVISQLHSINKTLSEIYSIVDSLRADYAMLNGLQ